AGDLVPGTEQHGADAGAPGEHGIDQAVGDLADLLGALAGGSGIHVRHSTGIPAENIPRQARFALKKRRCFASYTLPYRVQANGYRIRPPQTRPEGSAPGTTGTTATCPGASRRRWRPAASGRIPTGSGYRR